MTADGKLGRERLMTADGRAFCVNFGVFFFFLKKKDSFIF